MLEKKLWLKILIGMGLGALTGLFLGPFGGYVDPVSAEIIGEWVALPGYIFLGLLKMIVIPLIFASIILGVASSQNMSELKKTGLLTAAYSMLTTAIATGIGLGMALYIQPGNYISGNIIEGALGGGAQAAPTSLSFNHSALTLPSTLVGNLLPSNPLEAMANGEMLQVVIIAIIIGVALGCSGRGRPGFRRHEVARMPETVVCGTHLSGICRTCNPGIADLGHIDPRVTEDVGLHTEDVGVVFPPISECDFS